MSRRIPEADRADHQPVPAPACLVSAFHRVFDTGSECGKGMTIAAVEAAGLLLISIEADSIPLPRPTRGRNYLTIRWAHDDRATEADVYPSGDVWLWYTDRGVLLHRTGRITAGRAIAPLRRMIRRTFGGRYGRHDRAAIDGAMETGL